MCIRDRAIVNYLIVLAVVLVFTYQGFKYVGVAGKQISQGMDCLLYTSRCV